MEPQPQTNGNAVLTRLEAAQYLKISVSMLDLITKQRAIAVCRVGRRRLYTPKSLEAYLATIERPRAA